jgi:hypothetical protein
VDIAATLDLVCLVTQAILVSRGSVGSLDIAVNQDIAGTPG